MQAYPGSALRVSSTHACTTMAWQNNPITTLGCDIIISMTYQPKNKNKDV